MWRRELMAYASSVSLALEQVRGFEVHRNFDRVSPKSLSRHSEEIWTSRARLLSLQAQLQALAAQQPFCLPSTGLQ